MNQASRGPVACCRNDQDKVDLSMFGLAASDAGFRIIVEDADIRKPIETCRKTMKHQFVFTRR
ncbi:MAG: hypothetical protein HKO64_10290 [Xanthomonadales bacterium]|nr:hypothetical protein [Gammaproteobacteria bacterium]NNE04621.1 hypothetical protein [Xanthomonadales bacterium]NNL95996.1 hypothetical protein [Xanthomonadales bacterium]